MIAPTAPAPRRVHGIPVFRNSLLDACDELNRVLVFLTIKRLNLTSKLLFSYALNSKKQTLKVNLKLNS